jgi:hypothetical protein
MTGEKVITLASLLTLAVLFIITLSAGMFGATALSAVAFGVMLVRPC